MKSTSRWTCHGCHAHCVVLFDCHGERERQESGEPISPFMNNICVVQVQQLLKKLQSTKENVAKVLHCSFLRVSIYNNQARRKQHSKCNYPDIYVSS